MTRRGTGRATDGAFCKRCAIAGRFGFRAWDQRVRIDLLAEARRRARRPRTNAMQAAVRRLDVVRLALRAKCAYAPNCVHMRASRPRAVPCPPLMRTLAREGTTRVSALAKVALLDRTALSRALDPLVARGYVRVVAGRDMRTREATLTRAGIAALDEAAVEWKRAQAAVARRIGRDRLDTLIATLGELESLHPDEAALHAAQEPA
jgi:DNA-binding MarR family transcriptional regulator